MSTVIPADGRYATSLAAIEAVIKTGRVCVLDIDIEVRPGGRRDSLRSPDRMRCTRSGLNTYYGTHVSLDRSDLPQTEYTVASQSTLCGVATAK